MVLMLLVWCTLRLGLLIQLLRLLRLHLPGRTVPMLKADALRLCCCC
jgi:hypothetical protein